MIVGVNVMVDYILLEEYTENMHVLFVEDDEFIRKETTELLSDIFPNVDTAENGEEGLSLYKEFYNKNSRYYDLIVTDIKMPKMNGIDLTKNIYQINEEQPVIVLSAHSDSEYLMELVNIGIAQFITKPIEINNFVHVIFNISKDIYSQTNENSDIDTTLVNLTPALIWNKNTKKLFRGKDDIKLTKKELLLIDLLLQVTEKTYTVEEIIIHLWKDNEETSPDVKNLKNIISRLRKKIPELDIENVYGFGYKINIH